MTEYSLSWVLLGAFDIIEIKCVRPCVQEGEKMCIKIHLHANMVQPSFSILSYVHKEDRMGTGLEG